MSAERLRLVAEQKIPCEGDLSTPIQRHPDCNGEIWIGQVYFERNPKSDRYGTRHCVECYAIFFPKG